jgi:formiminotetrahydrofolate cyclodeaminase
MPESFLNALAKPQPDPGGGAAAAYGALLGLALLEKIIVLEQARAKENARPFTAWDNKLTALKSLFGNIETLRELDRKIYPRLVQARHSKAPLSVLTRIIAESITVPLEIMKEAQQGMALIDWVGARCKKNLRADLLVAGELLAAALSGAFHIGSSNLPLITEVRKKKAFRQKLVQGLQKGERNWDRIKKRLSASRHMEIS